MPSIRLVSQWYRLPNEPEISRMVRWLNKPDLMRYSEQRHRTHDFDTQCMYLSRFQRPPHLMFSVYTGEDFIGTVTAYRDLENKTADVGILIGIPNCGFGQVVWAECLDILFKDYDARKITAGCMSDNISMMRICEKTGMAIEGWQTKQFILESGSEPTYSHLVRWSKFKT